MKTENIKLSDFNNGRIYDKKVLDDLVQRCNDNKLYGELGDTKYEHDVNISNISHIVKNLEIFDDGIYGDIKILDTQSGNIIKSLISGEYDGLGYNISERSMGIVENGIATVTGVFSYDIIPFTDDEYKIKNRRRKIEKIKNIIKTKK